MPPRSINWFHSRSRLVLPVVLLAPPTADNPNLSFRATGLLDTGATSTGIRSDLAEALRLRPKGTRRIETANGVLMATEFLVRIGLVCGDDRDPNFVADQNQPYVLDHVFTGFELQKGFRYPAIIGMDVLGRCFMTITPDGEAELRLP